MESKMKGFKTVTQGCTTAGRLYNEDYDGPLIPLTKKDLERISKPPTTPPMESKMDDIKTVTYKGQVYQIDKPYLFLGTDGKWELGYLTKVNSASQFPFINHLTEDFSSIECVPEFRGGFGTITPAPIELEQGKAYTFDYLSCTDIIGLWCASRKRFIIADGCELSTQCKNIRPMTVVETLKGKGE